jgi:hypothetical protein
VSKDGCPALSISSLFKAKGKKIAGTSTFLSGKDRLHWPELNHIACYKESWESVFVIFGAFREEFAKEE